MLRWRGRLQEVHRWRLGGVILGEGHPQSELFARVDGAFRSADGDDPDSDQAHAKRRTNENNVATDVMLPVCGDAPQRTARHR